MGSAQAPAAARRSKLAGTPRATRLLDHHAGTSRRGVRAAPGSGPRQTLSAAMRPAAHHVIGDFWVELQADCMRALTIGLVWEISPTNSEELGTLRQIEAVRLPLIDRARERGGA